MLVQNELCRGEMKDTGCHGLSSWFTEKDGTLPGGASRLFPQKLLEAVLLVDLSTRPLVSTSFCFAGCENGWHFEQISTVMSFLVEAVSMTSPQAQRMVVRW